MRITRAFRPCEPADPSRLRPAATRLAPLLPRLLTTVPFLVMAASIAIAGPTVTTLATIEAGTGGLTVGPDGTIFHSDFGSMLGGRGQGGHRVYRVSPEGEAEILSSSIRGASGSEWGHDGALYQSSIGSNQVFRIEMDGTTTEFTAEGLFNPVGIATLPPGLDEAGGYLVANCGAGSIQRLTRDGASSLWVKSDLLKCPNGLVTDGTSHVYAANFMDGNVVAVDFEGNASVLATIPGNNNGHLFFHDDKLWVIARSAHQIYTVDLAEGSRGEVTLFAGSGEKGGADGPALEASFCYPNDLGFSPDGNTLYVNEVADHESTGQLLAPSRIRAIRLD